VFNGLGRYAARLCLALGLLTACTAQAQALATSASNDEPDPSAMPEGGIPRVLELYVGSVKTLKLGKISRVAVGNDAIVAATVMDSGELMLMPKSVGTTDIAVWTASQRKIGLRLRVDTDPIAERLAMVRAIMANYPNVKVRELNGTIILSGYVEPGQYEQFNKVASSLDKTVSLVRSGAGTGLQDMISFDVKIVEINKQYTKNLGIRWQDTAGGPAFGVTSNLIPNNKFKIGSADPGGNFSQQQIEGLLGTTGSGVGFNSYLGWTAGIGSQLEMLQANNAARILAEPRLSTLSGETAKFLAGGELPVAILNQFGQPVVSFKEYGIKLNISPVADRDNNIHCAIHAEVSSIDNSTKVNGVPGLLNRSTDATISARPGDTIAISGLVNVNDSRVVNQIPMLGDLPILGVLFKDKEFQTSRTDLLILVTPRIEALNEPVDPRIQQNIENLNSLLGGSSKLDTKLAE
jgi:pilus assembly protein CpaC